MMNELDFEFEEIEESFLMNVDAAARDNEGSEGRSTVNIFC
ncbi:hypothetical protein [Clostridium hydrogenum]|nr:hypothetical protein [Clostridium hydrogenum]